MSRQVVLDTIRLKPVRQLAHTDHSLDYHTEYCRKLTGKDPGKPGAMTP